MLEIFKKSGFWIEDVFCSAVPFQLPRYRVLQQIFFSPQLLSDLLSINSIFVFHFTTTEVFSIMIKSLILLIGTRKKLYKEC